MGSGIRDQGSQDWDQGSLQYHILDQGSKFWKIVWSGIKISKNCVIRDQNFEKSWDQGLKISKNLGIWTQNFEKSCDQGSNSWKNLRTEQGSKFRKMLRSEIKILA